MKTLALLSCLFLCSCATSPSGQVQSLTPEQIAAYGQLVHQGIQDYKTIKSIQ